MESVHTVYLGGGTPSYLPVTRVGKLMETIRSGYNITPDAEVTIEANPGTLDMEKLTTYLQMGINRISLGVQSTRQEELALLTRMHSYLDVIEAVTMARQAGFGNISLDLIYGLPDQTLASWKENIYRILELHPEHLSLYSLTVEEGTPLFDQVGQGQIPSPDPDVAGEMLEWSIDALPDLGFRQYEISNWAREDGSGRDYRSRHNLQYWFNRPYLGFGVGAHEYYDGLRVANVTSIPVYIRKMGEMTGWREPYRPAAETWSEIPPYEQMQDEMMLGLRLVDRGVDLEEFASRYGNRAEDIFANKIHNLVENGLLEFRDEKRHLCLTKHGVLLGNQVFMEFVGMD